VGAGISLLAGLLLWPRGARGELRQATAALYQAVAAYLGAGFDQVLQPGTPTQPRVRSLAVQTYDRAAEAFEQYLRERGAMPLNPLTVASFIAPGAYAILAGDLLSGIAAKGYRADVTDPDAKTIRSQAEALVDGFQALGRQLSAASPAIPDHAPVSEEALQAAAVHGLRRWNVQPGQEAGDDCNGGRRRMGSSLGGTGRHLGGAGGDGSRGGGHSLVAGPPGLCRRDLVEVLSSRLDSTSTRSINLESRSRQVKLMILLFACTPLYPGALRKFGRR